LAWSEVVAFDGWAPRRVVAAHEAAWIQIFAIVGEAGDKQENAA
jgi:hypothetical protein